MATSIAASESGNRAAGNILNDIDELPPEDQRYLILLLLTLNRHDNRILGRAEFARLVKQKFPYLETSFVGMTVKKKCEQFDKIIKMSNEDTGLKRVIFTTEIDLKEEVLKYFDEYIRCRILFKEHYLGLRKPFEDDYVNKWLSKPHDVRLTGTGDCPRYLSSRDHYLSSVIGDMLDPPLSTDASSDYRSFCSLMRRAELWPIETTSALLLTQSSSRLEFPIAGEDIDSTLRSMQYIQESFSDWSDRDAKEKINDVLDWIDSTEGHIIKRKYGQDWKGGFITDVKKQMMKYMEEFIDCYSTTLKEALEKYEGTKEFYKGTYKRFQDIEGYLTNLEGGDKKKKDRTMKHSPKKKKP